MKRLEVGDKIPQFSLPDQNGNMFDIDSVAGKKKFVLFFYPQDGSLSCTREACYFRDLSDAFAETDTVIIGISGQSAASHKHFAETNNLNYTILSDENDIVRKMFGVAPDLFGIIPGRVTYVADSSGKVAFIFRSQTNIKGHVDEALKICLLLKKTD